MGFFGSLFGGQNSTLSGDIANAGNTMNFGSALGQSDLQLGSDFYKTLLNGSPEAIGKLLGPQISNIQKQGQENLNTKAEFGDRSGGTNASNQTSMDDQRAKVEQMISQLTGQAAGAVTGIGENAINTGLQANQLSAEESQMQMQNYQNSIFGKSLTDLAQTGLNAAEGASGIF